VPLLGVDVDPARTRNQSQISEATIATTPPTMIVSGTSLCCDAGLLRFTSLRFTFPTVAPPAS
jgi:hypothetical protein